MIRSFPALFASAHGFGLFHWEGGIGVQDGAALHAVNAQGGEAWSFTSDDFFHGLFPGRDGNIYVTSGNKSSSTLYALASDGARLWDFTLPCHTSLTDCYEKVMVGLDGSVYFTIASYDDDNSNFALYSLDASGKVKWSLPRISSVFAVGEGRLFAEHRFAREATAVQALSSADGSVEWSFNVSGRFSVADCKAAQGRVHIVSNGGALTTLSADGRHLWNATLDASAEMSIGRSGTLYLREYSTQFHAFSRDGTEVLRVQGVAGFSAELNDAADVLVSLATAEDISLVTLHSDGTRSTFVDWHRRLMHFEHFVGAPVVAASGAVYQTIARGDGPCGAARIYGLTASGDAAFVTPGCGVPQLGKDGSIYAYDFTDTDALVLALRPDGSQKWNYTVPVWSSALV